MIFDVSSSNRSQKSLKYIVIMLDIYWYVPNKYIISLKY